MFYDAVPEELRVLPQWVNWCSKTLPNGKSTKVPVQVGGLAASTTRVATWSVFEAVCAAVPPHDGIGFVFTPGDPYFGIDLDHVVDDQGRVAEAATAILERFSGCYVERSPSGSGLHVIGRGTLPDSTGHKWSIGAGMAVEIYDRGRYFTMTGDAIHRGCTPLPVHQEGIGWLLTTAGEHRNRPTALARQGSTQTTGEGWQTIDITVDEQAEPPAALFALLASRRNFLATWNRTRQLPRDQSDSGYDMALADMAVHAGWQPQQVCNLLVAFRRSHGLDLKRLDYYQRTIHTALALRVDKTAVKEEKRTERERIEQERAEKRAEREKRRTDDAAERETRRAELKVRRAEREKRRTDEAAEREAKRAEREAKRAEREAKRAELETGQSAKRRADDAFQRVVTEAITEGGEGVTRVIKQLTGLDVLRYVQVGDVDASYRLVMPERRIAIFQSPKKARSQDAWQDVAQTITGVPFRVMPEDRWHQFMVLLSVILEREAPEETPQAEFAELLTVYAQVATSALTYDAVYGGQPMHVEHEGALYLNVPEFHTWLVQQKANHYRAVDVINWLKAHSGERVDVSKRLEGDAQRKATRKYWRLPWPLKDQDHSGGR